MASVTLVAFAFNSCRLPRGALRLIPNLLQPALQLFMERLEGIIDHRRLQEAVGKLREELVLQSILPNHDAVRTDAPVAMAGTAILDVTPASVAGDRKSVV